MLPACELSSCREIISIEEESSIRVIEMKSFSPFQAIYSKCKLPREKRSRSRSKEKYDETLSTTSDSVERDQSSYEKAQLSSENKPSRKNRRDGCSTALFAEQVKSKEDLIDYEREFQDKNLSKGADSDPDCTQQKIPMSINLALEDPRKRAFFNDVPTDFIKPNLVLDLDETLVNAALKNANFGEFPSKLELLKEIQIKTTTIILAIRPYLTTFLRETSKYYNLFLYTHAHQVYAEKVLELIDSEKKYFDRQKIFFNRESNPAIRTQKKTLKNLGFLPEEINRSLIIDDLKQVWVEHEKVIPSKKFMPFMRAMEEEKYKSYTLDIFQEEGKLAELVLDKDDLESYCETKFEKPDQLCCLLPFLKDLAFKFYDKQRYGGAFDLQVMDDLLGYQMRRVLIRCCIKIITSDPIREETFKRIATKLGANIADILDISKVSHIVVDRPQHSSPETNELLETIKNLIYTLDKESKNVRIVGVNWLLQCYFVLDQVPSAQFLLK